MKKVTQCSKDLFDLFEGVCAGLTGQVDVCIKDQDLDAEQDVLSRALKEDALHILKEYGLLKNTSRFLTLSSQKIGLDWTKSVKDGLPLYISMRSDQILCGTAFTLPGQDRTRLSAHAQLVMVEKYGALDPRVLELLHLKPHALKQKGVMQRILLTPATRHRKGTLSSPNLLSVLSTLDLEPTPNTLAWLDTPCF